MNNIPIISKNKRIAKNTLLLYIRVVIALCVSLYSAKVVLNTIGVVDFGIYGLVAGVVAMFSFINSSMVSSTQRFMAFEIGKKDNSNVLNVFNMCINIHSLISVVIIILAETLGLWFLNNRLVIPIERIVVVNILYQFTICSFVFNILSTPFIASIIAYERIYIYTYIGITEALLKLLALWFLVSLDFDKLLLHSFLVLTISFLVFVSYYIYIKLYFRKLKIFFYWNKALFKTLISYTGWNFFGNISSVASDQIVNILLNIFFGPSVNAARALSYQVKGAVSTFVLNFQMAINPQIVKLYAKNDLIGMKELVFRGGKYSYFIMFILCFPILAKTEGFLSIWLIQVPDYTVVFTRLILISCLIDSISGTLRTSAQATGNIKYYQITIGILLSLNFPLSYFFLELGYSPEVTFYINIFLSSVCLFGRLIIISRLVGFSILEFIHEVVIKVIIISLSSVLAYNCLLLISVYDNTLLDIFYLTITTLIFNLFIILFLGLDKVEFLFLKNKVFLKNII